MPSSLDPGRSAHLSHVYEKEVSFTMYYHKSRSANGSFFSGSGCFV